MIIEENKIVKWSLISVSMFFLSVMLVLPLVFVVKTAFEKGLPTFWAAISDKYARAAIWLTVEVTVITVIVIAVMFTSLPGQTAPLGVQGTPRRRNTNGSVPVCTY